MGLGRLEWKVSSPAGGWSTSGIWTLLAQVVPHFLDGPTLLALATQHVGGSGLDTQANSSHAPSTRPRTREQSRRKTSPGVIEILALFSAAVAVTVASLKRS